MDNITNYFERTVALLAAQFQEKKPDGTLTNFQKMLAAIVTQVTEIQYQEYLLNTMRWLATAQGVQLDGLGQIIGLARYSGQSDTSYREDLQFQIFINQSSGTPEQVIEILKYLTDASRIWYFELYPAAYLMASNGLTYPTPPLDPSSLVPAIQSCSPAGVDFVGITAIYNTNPFSFSNDPFIEQFFVAPDPDNILDVQPLLVNPGSGPVPFFINRGSTTNPNFGGGFAEAILGAGGNYTFDNIGAGQLAEQIAM
ncbi:MAG: hypothetical protein C5B43_01325 [Verrucomicrobia bacterium]|nr:MAG: hypothetical protein C5B43_01325 [Verrucomicrobiota bacterium]